MKSMLAMARRDIHISGIKDARHNHAIAPRDQELDFMSIGHIRQVTKGASDMTVLVMGVLIISAATGARARRCGRAKVALNNLLTRINRSYSSSAAQAATMPESLTRSLPRACGKVVKSRSKSVVS